MPLSKKQKRIARIAGNKNKIDAADFRKLKKSKKKNSVAHIDPNFIAGKMVGKITKIKPGP